MDVTLLELHLPGAQFNAPFSGQTARPAEGDREAVEGGGDASGPGALVALGLLVTLALLAWYLRRGSADEAGADE